MRCERRFSAYSTCKRMVDISSIGDGDYGFGTVWDGQTVDDLYEQTLAPQHAQPGLVAALQVRAAQDKELERQVKQYGEDELAPPLHAHDGLPGSSGVDASGCAEGQGTQSVAVGEDQGADVPPAQAHLRRQESGSPEERVEPCGAAPSWPRSTPCRAQRLT